MVTFNTILPIFGAEQSKHGHYYCQGRAVQTARSLDEGMRLVRPLGNAEVVFEENNGKLVHLTSPLRTSKVTVVTVQCLL